MFTFTTIVARTEENSELFTRNVAQGPQTPNILERGDIVDTSLYIAMFVLFVFILISVVLFLLDESLNRLFKTISPGPFEPFERIASSLNVDLLIPDLSAAAERIAAAEPYASGDEELARHYLTEQPLGSTRVRTDD